MTARLIVLTVLMAAIPVGSATAQSHPAAAEALLVTAVEPEQAPPPPPPPPPAPPAATPRAPRGRTPAAQPPPPAPPAPPAPPREGKPINVKVEVTITDKRPGATAITKTVTLVGGDSLRGSIRSEGRTPQNNTPLNVDVEPTILPDGKIRVGLNLQYDVLGQSEGTAVFPAPVTQIRDSVTMILESGKPMIVAQSADPVSDRQVTVEVKATVLR
jgi:hypothetical protein